MERLFLICKKFKEGVIISENKYTNEDLKTMQNWSLERKIQVSQTRILEWGGTTA